MKLFSPPTQDEWFFIGIVLFLVLMLITASELFRRLMNGNSEVTRKLVHVITGILMTFAPFVFVSGVPVMLISVLAIAGTFYAIRSNLLPSLHDTERRSYGTTFHPLAFLILVVALWESEPGILSVSILILAIPDALAAIAGRSARVPHYFSFSTDKKTVEGSSVMFLSTAILVAGFLLYRNADMPYPWFVIALVTALIVTAWELICTNGWDNLSVPVSTAFMLHFFLVPKPHHHPDQMLMAVFLSAGIGIISYRFHFLSLSGSVATFLLAVIIYGIGGWAWTIPILTFFIASSLLSKFGKTRKRRLETMFDKSDKRDAGQVAANGGIAGMLALLWYLFPERTELYYCYIGAIAAVTADTWGTEIGTLLKGKPHSIITLRTVEVGTSGGVSAAGFLGGAAGACLIALSAFVMGFVPFSVQHLVAVLIGGLAGSAADSILGGTVQAQYHTAEGKLTEKSEMNGIPTSLIRGYRWFNNDLVNWFCGLCGALTMYFLL